MIDVVAGVNQALAEASVQERRAMLRELMPTVVGWYRDSLEPEDPAAPADVALMLWVDELSAGLIGPLCAAAQDARASGPTRRPRYRVPGRRQPRPGPG